MSSDDFYDAMILEQAVADFAAFPDRLRLPLRFDVERLQADLARLDDADWTAHFVARHYAGDWSVLPLRAPAGAAHPIQRIVANPGTTDWADTELLAACPYFQQVLAAFACPLEGARLMRLGAGSAIREHRDADLGTEWGMARFHIPIRTSADVDFRLNGARVVMTEGSVWYLRLADPHSVVNMGVEDRIHLVLDARVDPWLAGVLRQARRGNASDR